MRFQNACQWHKVAAHAMLSLRKIFPDRIHSAHAQALLSLSRSLLNQNIYIAPPTYILIVRGAHKHAMQ